MRISSDRNARCWSRSKPGVCLAIWTLASMLSCEPHKELSDPNLFIILIDTLRVDRVGAFGGDPELTPFIDSFAESSYVFHNAYSTSSWTNPAIASLFTSRYPSQHQVLEFDSILSSREVTLAEVLGERGYLSAGFSANPLVARNRGFSQGFEVFQSEGGQLIKGREITERTFATGARALRWIDNLPDDFPGPIFVYLHVIDPHTPYAPDANMLRRVFGNRELPDIDRINTVMKTPRSNPVDEKTRDDVRGLYDAEVSSMDAGLERFFSELANRNLLEDSIIVIAADHGEELWDHDMFGHHHSLHEEVLRVPVLIHTPGQTKRRDVAEGISLLDIAPTVIDWLGYPPVERFGGRSLASLMSPRSEHWFDLSTVLNPTSATSSSGVVGELILAPIFRHTSHERTVIVDDKQLIRDLDGADHFIDLARKSRGPSVGDVSDAEKEVLRRTLDRFVAQVTQDPVDTEAAERIILDEESIDELRALGYVD